MFPSATRVLATNIGDQIRSKSRLTASSLDRRNMLLRLALCIPALCLLQGGSSGALAADGTPRTFPADAYAKQIAPLLSKYCSACHGRKAQEADIAFDKYPSAASVRQDPDTWNSVKEMLDFGAMPPEDQKQPTNEERSLLTNWIEATLQSKSKNLSDPGRVTIRRLNRAEYDNTVRDLTGLDLRLSKDFPSDDVGEGFDNIGDVLSLPPLLFEKYMDAAEHIAAAAISDNPAGAATQRRERKNLTVTGGGSLDDYGVYNLSSNGTVSGEFEFPRDGEYSLKVEAGAQQAGSELAKVELAVDDKRVQVAEVKAPVDQMEVYEIRARVGKGKHRFSAAFINDYYNPKAADPKHRDRNLAIRSLEVSGPVDRRPEDLSESHRRILIAAPGNGKTPEQAARDILTPFISRAFRRPARPGEVDSLVRLVDLAMEQGDSFERGIQVAISAVLVSPHFLFRVEVDPEPDEPTKIRPLNDYELASRLSYFLWSSMPDDELFSLAGRGVLHENSILDAQVRRMLQDDKAQALVVNFGGQWLNLRNLEEVTPDPARFGELDDVLRRDMERETEMFFSAVMREDRSILEFLTGDFTFVNERLARHYGMNGVTGEALQKVNLTDGKRIGLLTHASILTLTSNPTRTSPVKRGKWIMENILGTRPPDPPPSVPGLEETQKAAPNLSLREQMVLHRKDPVCASCHRQMDQLGFGFENFDVVGRWREKDGKFLVDASGELPSGETFKGPAELVQILAKRKHQFAETLVSKMLIYALGRGLEPYDQRAIDGIVERVEKEDYRFSAVITGIVTSQPFRMRRGDGGAE